MNLARFGLGILTNNEWLSDCKKNISVAPLNQFVEVEKCLRT